MKVSYFRKISIFICTESMNSLKRLYIRSYMGIHVLLNLSNEVWKKIRSEILPSILSVFPNELNKFNNTGARMQDYLSYATKIACFLQILHQNITISPLENTMFL